MQLLHFENLPIFEQLQIEEALLRADKGEWCLLNTGSPDAIVMGISGKPEKLLHLDQISVPVIKRFSGGGTVYIDEQTLFVTFIANGKQTPKPILEFSNQIYAPFFPKGFAVRENDYVIGEQKFGGNAQYIQKDRWLHHTSFLWDYSPEKMSCLKLPEKRPAYRGERTHVDFLCKLASHFPNKMTLIEALKAHLLETLDATEVKIDLPELLARPHRKGTVRLSRL